MKLSDVIEELVEERGLERTVLSDIIAEGMLAAYQKKYPYLVFQATYDRKQDDIDIKVQKKVVNSVEDEEIEISLRKARNFDESAELDQEIFVPFDGRIGRIEILRAKQVIANKIRQIEAGKIYEEFKEKQGTIVVGAVHKCERGGASIKLDDTLAFLPRSLSIPGEKCQPGYTVRALLKEVLLEPRNDNQLILDRVSKEFIQRLFELEIPEVFEQLVEIKKIARIAGYKTKIVVASTDKNIDPVGTCVGVGGVRIKPILKELGAEKIDVIPWTDFPEDLVKSALKPAVVNRVEIVDGKSAQVWIDEDQRSLAIGRLGQNIALASEVTGYVIQLMQSFERIDQGAQIKSEDFESNNSGEFMDDRSS